MGPENTTNKQFVLDERGLTTSINKILAHTKSKNKVFFIWGGEPLLHLSSLKKTIEYLKKHYSEYKIAFSTNGFLLKDKAIQEYILNKRLTVQLSVDGVAQNIRSKFNPLEDIDVNSFLQELINKSLLTINCVMHNKNPSISKNIDYFTSWMKQNDCLWAKLNIRFTPFNESDLTPDFNLSGDNLQSFIHEFEILYIKGLLLNKSDDVYKHFVKFPLKIIRQSNFEICDWENANQCSRFHAGKISFSRHIDTKGTFLSCNLIDSDVLPRGNNKKVMPEYCTGCEFVGMRGCWPCPAGDFPVKCEWKKSWMLLQKRMLLLKKLLGK